MRIIVGSTLVFTLAVTGCSTTSKQQALEAALKTDAGAISYLENLPAASPKAEMINTATWNALATQENSLFAISFDELIDEDGGQIAHNLKVALAAYPQLGLQAEKARIWGMSNTTLEALNANQPTKIADRIDLQNITYFGLEEWMEEISSASEHAFLQIAESKLEKKGLPSDELKDALTTETTVPEYSINYGRLVLDGLHWNGIEPSISVKEGESEETTQIWDFVSGYARWSRAFAIDAAVMLDTSGHIIIEDQGGTEAISQNMDMTFDLPMMGFANYDKGDTQFTVYKDMDLQMDQSISDENDVNMDIKQGSTTGLMVVRDMEANKLLSHLANRELPPVTSTNILSLGKWHIEDVQSRLGEDIVSESASFDMDLSNFHWLIPTKVSFDVPDATYNLKALGDFFETIIGSVAQSEDDFDADQFQQYFDQGMEVLAQYDLEQLNFAGKFGYNWDPETGNFDLGLDYSFKDLIGFDVKFDGAIGNFDSYVEMANSEDGFNEKQFEEIVKEQAAFSNAHYSINDYGVGLDKIFGLVIEFAKLVPEDEAGELAMLQNTDATNLRLMASSMMRMGGMAAKDEFPQGVKWANMAADFVQKGGKIEFAARPETTVTMKSAESARESGIETPEEILSFFGVEMTHDAPPEPQE